MILIGNCVSGINKEYWLGTTMEMRWGWRWERRKIANKQTKPPPGKKLTANAPENRPSQKETIVFQPSIFRGENVCSGRVNTSWFPGVPNCRSTTSHRIPFASASSAVCKSRFTWIPRPPTDSQRSQGKQAVYLGRPNGKNSTRWRMKNNK